jgi:uncharacterized protein (DUF433 family)
METALNSGSEAFPDPSKPDAGGMQKLAPVPPNHPLVARTERGLVLRGTRLTLYDIWERLEHGLSRQQVQCMYRLSAEQIKGVIEYIEEHRQAFEAEFQLVKARAQESRRYWELRNREKLSQPAKPSSGKEEAFARLQARRAELGQE